MKTVVLILFAGVMLFGVGAVAWIAPDLPPVRFVVSHGFPPAGGPTGRVKEIEGVRFVEIGTGYFRRGSRFICTKGDAPGRISKVFRLPWGKQPVAAGDEVPVRWVTIREPYWMAVTEVTNSQYERFVPGHGRSGHSPDDESGLGQYAWFETNCAGRARPVGMKRPNTWGLHDLHGNVYY